MLFIAWQREGVCRTSQPANLVINGDFEQGEKGWPTDMLKRQGVSIPREGGNSWLVLDGRTSVSQRIKLDPDWKTLGISTRMRVTGVRLGKEGWMDARLAMEFKGADGNHVDPWPNVFHAEGTGDWVRYEGRFPIPAGAAALDVSPGMLGESGKAEFDDIAVTIAGRRSDPLADLPPPRGAGDPWDMGAAWKTGSPTRETICLNGLWRFLPITGGKAADLPGDKQGWGWFKVPGLWPRSPRGAAQEVLLADDLTDADLGRMEQAWYRRALTVPAGWAGRRVLLDFTMVQTHARVLIDGAEAGEVFFPGGRLDVTKFVQPGKAQTLAILLTARPLEKESSVFMAPERIVTSKATVSFKGLTGDVFLIGEPAQQAIADVHVITSTRKGTITFDVGLSGAASGQRRLSARVLQQGKEVKTFPGESFAPAAVKDGRVAISRPWADAKCWDTDSPGNFYDAVVTLSDEAGKALDESPPVRFGFREFWIDGRDFFLNGKRIHLRAIHTTNVASPADRASLAGATNTCRRLKEYGFNFLITSNYDFSPGSVGYMDGLFQAADQEGVLASFSLPHGKDFNWKLDTPAQAERYRALTDWLVRRAQNHPSIVLYAMNHNATGYHGDQNPLRMDGIYRPDDPNTGGKPTKTREQAVIAAGIARKLDPTRPVYHHQSGNLGELYTVNIYLNWAPLQERSDWLEHWSSGGVKPMFFVEWGLPHVSSWSSYRGPEFIWRCQAFQQVWDSEFAAAYVGQEAYRMTPTKVKSMAHEESLWAKALPFYWSQLIQHLRAQDENYTQVQALFADDNWRSHRTWGISAMLPWDQENLWRTDGNRVEPAVPVAEPYKDIRRPGIWPDAFLPGKTWIYSMDANAIAPSALGRSFLRWNMPLCAYIGGGPERFTEKGHNFLPGETLRKQLVILNDTRQEVSCAWSWLLESTGAKGEGKVAVKPGDKAMVALSAAIPADARPGRCALKARFDFGDGQAQEDSIGVDVLAVPRRVLLSSKVALFDPNGLTAGLLRTLDVPFKEVSAGANLDGFGILVIGRGAMGAGAKIPDVSGVPKGIKVLVFEQEADALAALGFRVNVHGLRQAMARAPSHPALAALGDELLRDWRGASTLTPPHLDIPGAEPTDPKWQWCGFTNTRVWRCGNRGNVASVLIEKPERGDFLPIVDGGFDLQYAPLLEYAEGAGRIIFCQLDVTGRTENDPAALLLCANLLGYLDAVPAPAPRKVLYAGDACGEDLLKRLGVAFDTGAMAVSPSSQGAVGASGAMRNTDPAKTLLVLGPGAKVEKPGGMLEQGMNVLCLGLNGEDLENLLPGLAKVKTAPTIPSMVLKFDSPAAAGLSNAELHWRTRLTLPALQDVSQSSNEALKVIQKGKGVLVLCQAAPWMFDCRKQPYLRTTWRRNAFLVSRLLHNLGAAASCPLLERLAGKPIVQPQAATRPWLDSYYLQEPQAVDDPYRYYRW